MSTHSMRDRTPGRGLRAVRVFCSAAVLAGAGAVVAFRGTHERPPARPAELASGLTAVPALAVGVEAPAATTAAAVRIVEPATGGKLVICGGGKLPQPIRERFCMLAGGPEARIVVIPTATARADHPQHLASILEDWKSCKVGKLQLLHTRSRDEANDPDFARPLAEATGVWMTGGDQMFLTKAYLGTLVEKQLKAVLARGGVIGGTSAGAAVMSGVMIAGGFPRADVSQGFDFIEGAVIDQHFLKRNRVERLVGVLSSHPGLVGLGIDEQTALVVDVREHHLSVLGDSYVVACVPDSQHNSVRLKFLKSGDQTDMTDLKIPSGSFAPVLGLGSL